MSTKQYNITCFQTRNINGHRYYYRIVFLEKIDVELKTNRVYSYSNMTIVHQNKADSEKRSYAAVAAIPAIIVPAPIAVQNSFSALQDTTSDSEPEVDMQQFDWNSISYPSESDESDTITYEHMTNDSTEDSVSESLEDSANDSANDSAEDSTSESVEEELVVNHKHYRRVHQPWCKDGVPCIVTSIAVFLGIAYFMQFVFYMCGLVNDDCCSPAMRLQCSKYKGL